MWTAGVSLRPKLAATVLASEIDPKLPLRVRNWCDLIPMMIQSASDWEPVHTVNEFFDGPRRGFANYGGRPHAYSCEWDERADDWSAVYVLAPITDEQFALVREAWDIWRRWASAHQSQSLTLEDKHPALAGDWPRYAELKPLVDKALMVNKSDAIRAIPEFRGTMEPDHDFEVRWQSA